MRILTGVCLLAAACVAFPRPSAAQSAAAGPLPDPMYLVREVVYNEMNEHNAHGYWRYWIEHHSSKGSELDEQIETPEGPITRTALSNGRPLSSDAVNQEDARLQHLLSSPGEQAQHLRDYQEDERRIGRIMALLPDAFVYEPTRIEGDKYHLRFHPNPNYPGHSIEGRIFHAMGGDLWISVRSKHLVRLEGKLQENVDFGFGILGRLYRDGWFLVERAEVGNDWKTQRLEVHITGRAMLVKAFARETSEVRGGFTQVSPRLTLAQAATPNREPGSQAAMIPSSFLRGETR